MKITQNKNRICSGSAVLILLLGILLGCCCCSGTGETASVSESESGSDSVSSLPGEYPVLRDLTVAFGAIMPEGEDYCEVLPEGWTARMILPADSGYVYGEQTVTIELVSPLGSVFSESARLTLVTDTKGPVISGAVDRSVMVGDAIAYRKDVVVTDDCFGEVTLEVDSSAVHIHEPGDYPVIYRATDAAGNITELTVYVHVYADSFDEKRLSDLMEKLVAELKISGNDCEADCRIIYDYLQKSISYSGSSDKSDWKREAYRVLTERSGDCFSYYAAAKAFFDYLGYENLDLVRRDEIVMAVGERHYWSMINIAGEGEPARWYHFDACRLSAVYGYVHSGCLLTDAQVDAYTRARKNKDGVSGYFYAYDKSAYPASATEILTPTPGLEPYMQ